MPLSLQEAGRAWELFKDSPLFARRTDVERDFAYRLTSRHVNARDILFRPGDVGEYLYLVADGEVLETLPGSSQSWFQNRLHAKQYCGQDALFTGRHSTGAEATRDTDLYLMAAGDVRLALEKNTDLRENLLFEKRASRLREIPLFECLSSGDIAWLALLMQEISLPAKANVPLARQPGLWVIDRGQVEVDGSSGFELPGWRLSAGNFFLPSTPNVGPDTSASSAMTYVNTSFFWLKEDHFRRLIAAFPDVRTTAGSRLDIVTELQKARQLDDLGMNEEHFRHLAQFCAWDFVPAGQNISTQGAVGYSFVILLKGAALVSSLGVDGKLRPQNLLRAGDAFGRTSLLDSKRRDATVRAVSQGEAPSRMPGAEILTLDRRDVRHAFADRPDLWKPGVWLYDHSVQIIEPRRHYPWQQEGETITWEAREHWLWLARPEAAILLAFIFLLVVALGFEGTTSAVAIGALLLFGVVVTPVALLLALNHYRDYYVITNRRVTRRDQRLLVWDEIVDAQLEMVQDVTVDSGLLGRIFDYGTVTIRTAAKVGEIRFVNVPAPEEVKNRVMQERAGVTAATSARDKEVLRKGIIESLQLSQPVPDPDASRALGQIQTPVRVNRLQRMFGLTQSVPRDQPLLLPGVKRPKPTWLIEMTRWLPKNLQFILVGPPAPALKPNPGQVIFRKHVVNLLKRAGKQMAALTLLLTLFVVALYAPLDRVGIDRPTILLPLGLLLFVAFLWFWYKYEDYRNDIYLVTDEKIVDIERKPLALSKVTQETSLDRVQNVTSQQKGLWANLLDYGDVVIQTAAADRGITFSTVAHPQQVQRLIFQKMDERRRRQEERALGQRQRELIEGLKMYDEMLGERNAGRI
jgi:CRP-like cAMP-binding protein/membrane protein YdbS with pleckstrin-like domain